jgi:predicted membrane protein
MQKISLDFSTNFFGGSHFLSDLTGVGMLISILLSNAFVIAGIIFVILIIFGGIQMISGAGKSKKG